ncbi:MAG: AAA family ATPase [Proteobacteria bacterium]|nr:AAA family ATPase [Pseudomonadota bacterium]
MICTSCQSENPPDARFCMACGRELGRACASCGSALPSEARFCLRCGEPRAEAAESSAPAPGPRTAPFQDGERRQLTVMFCDLVDSTELSQQLDPEDLQEVVRAYQTSCGEVIADYGGEIAQYLGDGLLVYFGYPLAYEDSAERAVRAALSILGQMPALSERLVSRFPALPERGLDVRLAVHSGPVVVADMGGRGRQERLALGDTLNIAARLQGLAASGTVCISEATRRLVGAGLELEDLGSQKLKGIAEPVAVYRVLELLATRNQSGRRLTPFVGREQELALLLDRWEQVKDGRGHVMLLQGEAGMGKSRLVQVLRQRLEGEALTWLEGRCTPLYASSAFHPAVEVLEQLIGFQPGDTPERRLDRLERALAASGLPTDEGVPLLSPLLAIPLPGRVSPLSLNPEAQRRRSLELLVDWLCSATGDRPVVLVLEDLHWVDPSTLELLGMIVEQAPRARLLLLLTFRPGFENPWRGWSHLAQLTLNPLTRTQMGAMIREIAGGVELPPELLERVVEKTDGVPLFVEELTKTVLESDLVVRVGESYVLAGRSSELAVPTTLQDWLMARLDRLGSAKEVAQLGAVLGRDFSYELLEAVSPLGAAARDGALSRLVAAELLHQRGTPPRAVYTFKHALIHDTAYQSLLRSTRQEFHARIAGVLEARFPELAASEPETIAHHFDEAGLPEPAVAYYRRAGEVAMDRSANAEALVHLTRGLDLLAGVPSLASQELGLLVPRAILAMAVEGASDEEVEQIFARVRALCDGLEADPRIRLALFALSVFHAARGELVVAAQVGERLLAEAERSGESSDRVAAHLALGVPHFWQGEPGPALDHLEQTIALYDPWQHRELAYAYGQDPGVSSLCYAGLALWQVGQPDRALDSMRKGLDDSREDLSLAQALCFAGILHWLRGEIDDAREMADKVVALSEDRGFSLWLGAGQVLRGWAATQSEKPDETGIAEIEAGIAQLAGTGTGVAAPIVLTMLAESQRALGRPGPALDAVDAALELADQTGSTFVNPELLRLRADLLAERDGDRAEVEALLERSLDMARAQGARSFELRIVATQLRLAAGTDRAAGPRARLREIYEAFDEGLDTLDLRAARALLKRDASG